MEMKIGDLVRHVPHQHFPHSNLSNGVYLVAGLIPAPLNLVSIMDVHGKTWSACRVHLEVISENR